MEQISNIQILTIAIALGTSFLAVLAGVLINNTRLGDLKESLRLSITESKETLRAEAGTLRADLRTQHVELMALVERNHSEMMLKLSDIEGRLSHIENERRITER